MHFYIHFSCRMIKDLNKVKPVGSVVVECLTRDQGAVSTGSTQEDPSLFN